MNKTGFIILKDHTSDWQGFRYDAFKKHGGIKMERPMEVNLIYAAGGDLLCTLLYIEEKDCTARFATGAI